MWGANGWLGAVVGARVRSIACFRINDLI